MEPGLVNPPFVDVPGLERRVVLLVKLRGGWALRLWELAWVGPGLRAVLWPIVSRCLRARSWPVHNHRMYRVDRVRLGRKCPEDDGEYVKRVLEATVATVARRAEGREWTVRVVNESGSTMWGRGRPAPKGEAVAA